MSLLSQLDAYKEADFFSKKMSHIVSLVNAPALTLAEGLVNGIGSEKARERVARNRQSDTLLRLNRTQSLEVILYHIAMGHAAAAITLTGSDRSHVPIFDIEILKLFFQHKRPQDIDKALAMIFSTTAYSVVALSAIGTLTEEEREKIRNRSTGILAKSKRPEFNDSRIEDQKRHVETALRHKIQMLLFLTAQMPSGKLKEIAAKFIPQLEKIAALPSDTDLNIYAIDGDVSKYTITHLEDGTVSKAVDRRTYYQLQPFAPFGLNGANFLTKIYSKLEPYALIVQESDMRTNVSNNDGSSIRYLTDIPFLEHVLKVIEGSKVSWTYETYRTYSQMSARCYG
ncbi:MAG: hypothetical protein ACK5XX_07495 [Holosporales bacterium]